MYVKAPRAFLLHCETFLAITTVLRLRSAALFVGGIFGGIMAKTIGPASLQLLQELLDEKKIPLTDQRLRDSNCMGRIANAGLAVLDREQQAYVPTPEGAEKLAGMKRDRLNDNVITLPEKSDASLPSGLAAPARRALLNAGITRLDHLANWKESDVLKLHGMGPNAVRTIRHALTAQGRSFAGFRSEQ